MRKCMGTLNSEQPTCAHSRSILAICIVFLAMTSARAQDENDIVRSASLFRTIRNVCPQFYAMHSGAARKFEEAYLDLGNRFWGEEFHRQFEAELSLRNNEVKITGPAQWCNYQRANLKASGIKVFVEAQNQNSRKTVKPRADGQWAAPPADGGVTCTGNQPCVPHVPTNAALQEVATTTHPNGVWRDDYASGRGAPPTFYTPSASACSLNEGAGDNGSQVQSADGKCWIAHFSDSFKANILEWGADPTGSTNSDVAIQAAIDYTYSLTSPTKNDSVYCPAGQYSVDPLLFLDAPNNMRGANGSNGTTWDSDASYHRGYTVNYAGVPYVSLVEGNLGNTPSSSPSDWKPFIYSNSTTYNANDLVSYGVVAGLPPTPWVATQSVTGTTPALGSTYWQPATTTAGFYGYGYSFVGDDTGQVPGSGKGCVLNESSGSGVGLWIGPGNGNLVKGIQVVNSVGAVGRDGTPTGGLNPYFGIGIGIAGGDGGANSTTIDHVGVSGFYTAYGSAMNCCYAVLGAENTFIKTWSSGCQYGFYAFNTNNFLNSFYDNDSLCKYAIYSLTDALVVGGNWSQWQSEQDNTFTISGTSALSLGSSPYITSVYQFTTTINSPDTNITGCTTSTFQVIDGAPPQGAACVYDSWIIRTQDFGLIPLVLVGWNANTNVATFQTYPTWSYFFNNNNALSVSNLSSEVQVATTIYAVDRPIALQSNNLNASSGWIEQTVGNCQTLAEVANVGVISSPIQNTDPSGGTGYKDLAQFYCMQAFPYITGNPLAGGTIKLENFYDRTFSLGAVILDTSPNAGINPGFIFDNFNAGPYRTFPNLVTRQQWLQPSWSAGGPSVQINQGPAWMPNPGRDGPNLFYASFQGWFPTANTEPNVNNGIFTVWMNPSAFALSNYPPAYGGTVYKLYNRLQGWTAGANSQGDVTLVESDHFGASYGQQINTTNNPGMSLAWQAGSFVVRADAGTLGLVFPGLSVLLNNGSGDEPYIVTGVYPNLTLDGGTHPGYFTVLGLTGNYMLTGTVGTNYTATQMDQPPFTWRVVGNYPQTYTVSTLPTASSPVLAVLGLEEYVSDATSCTYNHTVTGGGSTLCHVRYNGTNWVAN